MEHPIIPLNFHTILIKSLTIIFSSKKIFTQITIATIFPLSLLSLSHAHISHLPLFSNPNPNPNPTPAAFCLFNAAYVASFLALSLVSTAAAVEAVARAYTANEARLGEVMGIVPRVWKRVLLTFLWSLMVVVVYNMAALSLLSPWIPGSGPGPITGRAMIVGPIFAGFYVVGFVYISIIWHLASVVSVLEEDCGVGAMIKSMGMVKGRMVILGGVFLLLNLCFLLVQVVFKRFVVVGDGEVMVWRIGVGIVCFLVLSWFTLVGIVTQTVVYFDCKLYHSGIIVIPSSYFGDQHRVDLGDYAPLRSNALDHC